MPLIVLQILAAFAATCTIVTGLTKLIGVIQKWRRESAERKAEAARPAEDVSFVTTGPETSTGAATTKAVNNLPIPLTAIVGRAAEQAELAELLTNKNARLVTLTGPGGVGKTRLALEVAHQVASHFTDGVIFVPLATVTACEDVLPMLADALDMQETSASLADDLKQHLAGKHVLLVMDNFENVMACAPKLADLLTACPNVKALVTSRAVLRVQGERQMVIAPLPAPLEDVTSTAGVANNEAVRLFTERARDVQPGFEITDTNASAVAEITRRLEGLPLALELAAARVKLLSPQDLLSRLDSRLKILTGGSPENTRQQTMRDAVAWSYELLEEHERALFRRLGVFADSFTLDAAEGAFGDDEETGSVLDVVETLVDESLVQQIAGGRLAMMGMVREFAQERLAASGEEPTAHAHHASYYLHLVTDAAPAYRTPNRDIYTTRINDELANVRLAFEWFLTNDEDEPAMRLAGHMRWFFMQRGWAGEGRRWAQRALNAGTVERTPGRAEALLAAGQLAIIQGDDRAARHALEQSVRMFRGIGTDQRGLAEALCFLGNAVESSQDPDSAENYYQEALEIHDSIGNTYGSLHVLMSLGLRRAKTRDYAGASDIIEDCLVRSKSVGDMWTYAHALNHLGDMARCQGNYARAGELYNQALASFEAQGQRRVLPSLWHNLAYVALHAGDFDAALAGFRDSLSMYQDQSDARGTAECLAGIAAVYGAMGDWQHAARLFGASEAMLKAAGTTLWPSNRPDYDRYVALARSRTDEGNFYASWVEGRGMSSDATLELAKAPSQDAAVA